ncbi:DUF4126 domain-containing protein [Mangrovimonas sp. YM274]|uniref:DUF4126 domain-containing protein n=1 Tax=Mangrovimonas sp. YM274 TaxID=3070660 RepID=UPI0027DC7E65|nr:DUF4126 domain-containing protein [Mangrovimonas sp. YM274]WMI67483.1 DUF4126 domain-containing protein [Mangrovimonas sp. YM274]
MTMDAILGICLGIGLSASVGFRVFLPLFALSLVTHFGLWEVNEAWLWVGSSTALVTLGIATLVEIVAYYIPFVDNLLDTIAIPLASIAGTLVVVVTATNLDPVVMWSLAIIAGGGTAAAIKSGASATRATSSVSTAGLGNPIVSSIETGASAVMSVMSIFLPVIAFILTLTLLYVFFRLYKKIKRS